MSTSWDCDKDMINLFLLIILWQRAEVKIIILFNIPYNILKYIILEILINLSFNKIDIKLEICQNIND